MSDPKSSYGEPVDEPNDVDPDVVSRAREGLAEAEAARRQAEDREAEERAAAERVEREAAERDSVRTEADAASPREPAAVVVEETVVEERAEADGVPWYERDDVPLDDEPATVRDEPTTARDEPVYPREPVSSAEPATTPVAPAAQPIFVQAPEAPRPRGNRGAAGAIGLVAALVFAILYLAAWLGLELIYDGGITFAEVPEAALGRLTTWAQWVPVVAFYLGFWLLGAFINRGRWGHWVVWGLLVGLAAYGGHILGQLFQAPFWMLTAREGADMLEEQLLAPLAIVAFVLGRELTIWFGAWVAARGRRATELNDEAQREYERTLEAGPQLRQG